MTCEDYEMMINNISKTKNMVFGRKPKEIGIGTNMNPSNKWTASNTCGTISVAT